MSHIFISYAHDDKVHLDKLVAWLRENKFADHEIWYDHHLEAGNSWRDEITTALNEAFVVLVIVTKTSMTRHYCTYEWAYAMGQGVSVLPLVFTELSITDAPAPLAAKQFINCAETIPDYLAEQVRRLRSVPPQVAAINKIIYETIHDTHRRFFILGWVGDGIDSLDPGFEESVLNYFMQEAAQAQQILETLMMDKAFALSGKQYRYCWQLIDFLKEFSKLKRKIERYLQNQLFSQFETIWLPAFEYFEPDTWWRWSKETKSSFTDDLENEHTKMEIFAEMMRVFPIFNVGDAEILIENKAIDQKRNQK